MATRIVQTAFLLQRALFKSTHQMAAAQCALPNGVLSLGKWMRSEISKHWNDRIGGDDDVPGPSRRIRRWTSATFALEIPSQTGRTDHTCPRESRAEAKWDFHVIVENRLFLLFSKEIRSINKMSFAAVCRDSSREALLNLDYGQALWFVRLLKRHLVIVLWQTAANNRLGLRVEYHSSDSNITLQQQTTSHIITIIYIYIYIYIISSHLL